MGILIAGLFLIINLFTNSHYDYTWDLPHHFNAGLRHLGLPPQDPSFGTQPYGPLSDTLPVLSWLYLFKNWHILPADEAYHILIILCASIGILLIYKITKEIFGFLPAFFASLILTTYPRYIGESHNNIKDIPSAVIICLALYLFYRLVKSVTIETQRAKSPRNLNCVSPSRSTNLSRHSFSEGRSEIQKTLLPLFSRPKFSKDGISRRWIEAPRAEARGIFRPKSFNPSVAEITSHSSMVLKNHDILRRWNKKTYDS